MDLDALAQAVRDSKLLTEQEKTYWTERLPRMNPDQIAKLNRILSEASSIPWNEQIEQCMQAIARGTSPLIK